MAPRKKAVKMIALTLIADLEALFPLSVVVSGHCHGKYICMHLFLLRAH